MGATVVRSKTLGTSVGCPLCLKPALTTWNDPAFASIDYAIYAASYYGIRLIIPLTDFGYNSSGVLRAYYHGGISTFCGWRSVYCSDSDTKNFYANQAVVSDYIAYIDHILDHTNPWTNRQLKNEPAILMWETGNELYGPPANWTELIANYIKYKSPNALVMDGAGWPMLSNLYIPTVDVYSKHFYDWSTPGTYDYADFDKLTGWTYDASKVFVSGEYDWTLADCQTFLSTMEATDVVAGGLFWSFFPHNDTYGYVKHNDGYTAHYPGDSPIMKQFVTDYFPAHAEAMSGTVIPPYTPSAPMGVSVSAGLNAKNVNVLFVSWQGSPLAATYKIQVKKNGAGNWIDACGNSCFRNIPSCTTCAPTDGNTPFPLLPKTINPNVVTSAIVRVAAVSILSSQGNWSTQVTWTR